MRRGEEKGQSEREKDMSPGVHFNSLICPIFLCSFCLDDCGTLHIFTLEADGEGGCMHVCYPEHQGLVFCHMRWAKGGQDCEGTNERLRDPHLSSERRTQI